MTESVTLQLDFLDSSANQYQNNNKFIHVILDFQLNINFC